MEEYRNTTLKLNEIIFTSDDFSKMKNVFDYSCSSAVQLFLGTNITSQVVVYSDTIISLPIKDDLTKNQITNTINYLNPENLNSSELKYCPKTEELNNNNNNKDLNHFITFGTPSINKLFSQNPLNNFNIAIIDNTSTSYFYVGDQYIYQLNTYMNGSKVKVGKRQKTLMYHAILLKKMNPYIEPMMLFQKLRWLVDTYYELPYQIDNNQLIRLSRSVVSKEYDMEKDKRIFIRNPEINHLSKGDKIKEFHKCKNLWMKNKLLGSLDLTKTITQISHELGYSPTTIRKYLKLEGIDLVKIKSENQFEMFRKVYVKPENKGKSIRKLAVLTGLSKSQVQRYILKIKEE